MQQKRIFAEIKCQYYRVVEDQTISRRMLTVLGFYITRRWILNYLITVRLRRS